MMARGDKKLGFVFAAGASMLSAVQTTGMQIEDRSSQGELLGAADFVISGAQLGHADYEARREEVRKYRARYNELLSASAEAHKGEGAGPWGTYQHGLESFSPSERKKMIEMLPWPTDYSATDPRWAAEQNKGCAGASKHFGPLIEHAESGKTKSVSAHPYGDMYGQGIFCKFEKGPEGEANLTRVLWTPRPEKNPATGQLEAKNMKVEEATATCRGDECDNLNNLEWVDVRQRIVANRDFAPEYLSQLFDDPSELVAAVSSG